LCSFYRLQAKESVENAKKLLKMLAVDLMDVLIYSQVRASRRFCNLCAFDKWLVG